MKDIRIGVIGGTRGMGKWFADFLKDQGYVVHVSGRKSGLTMAEMAARCQVVVVSVPIGATTDIIAQVGPLMGEESLLMDLTSLKSEPVRAMLKFSRSEVIGCHPLFGPQVPSLMRQNVIVCPARGERWLSWLKDLLTRGGALITETGPEKHDEIMSIVQGLNHFNTIMMGLALSRTSAPLAQLDGFTTPFFDAKAGMVKKIFSENPRLYTEIICNNHDMTRMVEIYRQVLEEIKPHIIHGDAEELTAILAQAAHRLWPEE